MEQTKQEANALTPIAIKQSVDLVGQLMNVEVTSELVASPDFALKYEQLVTLSKYFDDFKKNVDMSIKEVVKEHYFETGENNLTSDKFKYTYIPETTRETFNSRAFKKDNPELYKQYVKVSSVSDSVKTFKVQSDKKDAE